jgi:hypothetical protein
MELMLMMLPPAGPNRLTASPVAGMGRDVQVELPVEMLLGDAFQRDKFVIVPALLTRMSSGPNAFCDSANKRSISVFFATSARIATALPPAPTISVTTFSAPALLEA